MPMPFSSRRAREVIQRHESAFGSDISDFLTAAEIEYIRDLVDASRVNTSFRAEVYRIARNNDRSA